MNRRFFATFAPLFSLAVIAGSPALAADPVPSGDLGKLQGSWTVQAGPKRDIAVTLVIRGDEATLRLQSPLGVKVQAEGRVRIDERTNPKTIDWTGFSLADGQDFPDILGIYELSGDSFRLVNGGPSDKRPTEFKKGDGALADLLVFTRSRDLKGR